MMKTGNTVYFSPVVDAVDFQIELFGESYNYKQYRENQMTANIRTLGVTLLGKSYHVLTQHLKGCSNMFETCRYHDAKSRD